MAGLSEVARLSEMAELSRSGGKRSICSGTSKLGERSGASSGWKHVQCLRPCVRSIQKLEHLVRGAAAARLRATGWG